ncbi:MAG: LysR family transcriptional regulator [Ornithinimicrobium sp.]
MELRTIRYFVAVADAGSVSSAATQVHITQPSLSRQLHHLEHELGLSLFSRDSGRLILSPAGHAFLPAARELLRSAEITRSAARSIAAGRLESITILATSETLTDVVAPFIATFHVSDPTPSVGELKPGEGYSSLNRGVDLVLGFLPPSEEFAHVPIARFPVYAYAPAQSAVAQADSIALVDLIEYDLLLLAAPSETRRLLDAHMTRHTFSYRSVKEFTSSQVAQAVAATGRGLAVVSDDPRFGLRGLWITTPQGSLALTLYAAWRTDHHAASMLQGFADRLSNYVAQRYGHDVEPVT